MRYLYTLEIIHSLKDRWGNVYWAFRFIDHASGKVVEAKADGESNINSIRLYWDGAVCEWNHHFVNRTIVMKIRDFDRFVKNLPYVGSGGPELAKYIKEQLTK